MTPNEAHAELQRDYPSFENMINYVSITERLARREAEARVKELEDEIGSFNDALREAKDHWEQEHTRVKELEAELRKPTPTLRTTG